MSSSTGRLEEKSDNDGADEECKDDDITDGKKDENEGESEDVLYDISEQDVLEENTASKVADGKQDDNKSENTKQDDKVADKTSEGQKPVSDSNFEMETARYDQ